MRKKLAILFIILSVLWTLFIWSNSLKNAIASSDDSNIVVRKVEAVLENNDIDYFNVNLIYLIRKSAHFFEFSVQAILIGFTHLLFKSKYKDFFIKALFFGLLTAVVDEYIQLFTNGRGSRVSDVLIDFFGFTVGFIFLFLTNKLKNYMCYHRSARNVI